jgi:hypothetical protein
MEKIISGFPIEQREIVEKAILSYKESLWHPGYEAPPEPYQPLLVITSETYEFLWSEDFNRASEKHQIEKWLYIDDLL